MSHDESLKRTYEERKAARLADYYGMNKQERTWGPTFIGPAAIAYMRGLEIRRLRRALWQITRSRWEHSDYLAACKCGRCIAKRALKGTK